MIFRVLVPVLVLCCSLMFNGYARAVDDLDAVTSHGHVKIVVINANDHRIQVDGKTAIRDTDSLIDLIQSVQENPHGNQTYVLIEEASGGVACPAMYQALEIAYEQTRVSPIFGTCSDLPRLEIVNDGLVVSLPKLDGSGIANFAFKNGRMENQ